MPALTFVAYQTVAGDTDMSRITDLDLHAPAAGGRAVLYATTRFDGALTAWAVGPAGISLTDSAAYQRPDGAGAVADLGFVQTGPQTSAPTGGAVSLLSGGGDGGPLTLRLLGADGSLGPAQSLSNPPAFGGDLVEPLTVTLGSGAQVVYGGIAGHAGIGRVVFDATGQLTGSGITPDDPVAHADQVTALAAVTLAGGQYVFSASTADPGVTSWAVGADGGLTARAHLGANQGLWIAAPTALSVATLGAQTYLLLAAAGSGSISVMEILPNGSLRVIDHVIDDLGSRFAGVTALATVSLDGQTYIFAGGADDGISVMQLLPGGQLIARAHIADTQGMGLQNISALTAQISAGGIDIFAASSSETGITMLRFDPGPAGITRMTAFPGETLTGTTGNDIFIGGAGTDRLSGADGADILADGAGNDLLYGGAGADIFILTADGVTDRIQDFTLGQDQIDLSGWGLLRNIGQLSITASSTGMTIRYGTEVLVVRSNTGTPIDVARLQLTDLLNLTHIRTDLDLPDPDPDPQPDDPDPVSGDLVGTILSDVLTGPAEATRIFGLDGHDALTGGLGVDSLFGGHGNDTLDGQDSSSGPDSADHLQGGVGNDTYIIRNAGSCVVEGSTQGRADRVMVAVSYVLAAAAGVEILQTLSATGTAAIDLTGNGFSQRIIGNAGTNVLRSGGGGADTLEGLGGDDIYQVSNSADVVLELAGQGGNDRLYSTVSYALRRDAEIELLSASSHTATTALNLTGNALAQAIFGNAGANLLDDGGFGAADILTGLGGDDSYVVRNAGTQVVETAGQGLGQGLGQGGADRVFAALSFTLAADAGIEFLQTTSATGTGAINLTGNALAQAIFGNAGANVLDDGGGPGAAAADTLTGLGGNDTYLVRNAGSRVVEGSTQGTADRVLASVSYVLAADAGIEVLQTLSAAGTGTINLTGNGFSQRIIGNAGANRIDGKGGKDILTGGAGADRFVFATALGSAHVAVITDYSVADDTIWLDDALFTGLTPGTLAVSAFGANATGLAGDASDRLIYDTDTGALWYDRDGTGAGNRLRIALLDRGLDLTAADLFVY